MRDAAILIVGAGFSGCVYARCLADAGIPVHVIDKRPHVGGNAYDEVAASGVRVHRYGPHLFHSANKRVLEWVHRFGDWTPFTHRVKALLPSGRLAPMPINLDTVNMVFDKSFTNGADVEAFLASVALKIERPQNAAEHLYANIGTELTDLFFRPYTKKMWALDLEDMSAAVVKRVPIRADLRDTYFPDSDVQIMPKNGYTAFFESVLEHPLISVALETPFDHAMLENVEHCFASLPIDEFYKFSEGELPYRSIRFHHRIEAADAATPPWNDDTLDHSVVNFTDSGPFTRETAWHLLPGHLVDDQDLRHYTREEPCDYKDNGYERYYPVKTADGRNEAIYQRYVAAAAGDAERVTFIGRCGTYRYLDMDQVISQSLSGAGAWLRQRTGGGLAGAYEPRRPLACLRPAA